MEETKKEIKEETNQETNDAKKEGKLKSFFKDLLSMLITFIITVIVYQLVFTFVLDRAVVEGSSMVPTLHSDDQLISSRIFDIEQGDIIIINSSKLNKKIVKRVIGIPGQKVDIDFEKGTVTVDGKALNEQLYSENAELTADYFVNTLTTINSGAFSDDEYPVTVPDGYLFVMGDNRNVSLDSKNISLGLVPVEEAESQVLMRYSPIKDIRIFK